MAKRTTTKAKAKGKTKTTKVPTQAQAKAFIAKGKDVVDAQVAKAKEGPAPARAGSKLELIITMMKAKGGTTLADMAKATKWAPTAVRGVIYNAVKGRLGLTVTLTPHDDGTVFTIANGHTVAAGK